MKLNSEDQKRLIGFYRSAYERFGVDARSLQWVSEYNQLRRFDILLQIGDLDGKAVLDVGCGLADLHARIEQLGIEASYTGIDIMPDFIAGARERFPALDLRLTDIWGVDGAFDYVLASGTLTFNIENYKEYYFAMVRRMYDAAKIGVAFNMLDRSSHAENGTYATYDPKEVAAYCETFCENVQVNIGYMPDDFTVYLYHELQD